MNPSPNSSQLHAPPKPGVGWLVVLVGLLMLAVGVWWYFEYKIQRLERPPEPAARPIRD